MRKYVLFGGGQYAKNAITLLDRENIEFILDNDRMKTGTTLDGIPIYTLNDKIDILNNYTIVVTVSEKYIKEICAQIEENGIKNYILFSQIQFNIIKDKIEKSQNYINVYNKAINWIKKNTIPDEGIITNSTIIKSYPEVTGYFIPSLIRWGYRDIAVSYTNWLLSIQKEDGSWYDTYDKAPYIFDSAQIIKGLLAARKIYKDSSELDKAIIKGCNWILSCMNSQGRLITPDKKAWGNDEATCSELIHTYCLSPLIEAGKIYNKPEYIKKTNKILNYYIDNFYDKITNFSLLSHFYAYVIEAMIDLGQIQIAQNAMNKISIIQKENGAVPAYNNVDWVCSTGLFQFAVIWFRLGEIEKGNKAFEYACKLQNESGGWYGSYISEDNPYETNTYFPAEEISWAVKYFLDALYYKNLAEFNSCSSSFLDIIDINDGRYQAISNEIKKMNLHCDMIRVLDIGCGKGRYLKNLLTEYSYNKYYATDISEKVTEYIDSDKVTIKQGSLTDIPFDKDSFDITYTCEALEHAIDIESAVAEMIRVTKPNGKIIIIDKNKAMYGTFEICALEQWFDENELKSILMKYCSSVEVLKEILYDNKPSDNLFYGWVGTVKEKG